MIRRLSLFLFENYLPDEIVDGNGGATGKFITYKFTGQYFEFVKN